MRGLCWHATRMVAFSDGMQFLQAWRAQHQEAMQKNPVKTPLAVQAQSMGANIREGVGNMGNQMVLSSPVGLEVAQEGVWGVGAEAGAGAKALRFPNNAAVTVTRVLVSEQPSLDAHSIFSCHSLFSYLRRLRSGKSGGLRL
mmetsp:Transcript_14335/g.38867  ORF Transcript_14335/g.38867 Transcript_14335/m.38867 type:complete len:142 (+) Transcript_14335:346-771(+)